MKRRVVQNNPTVGVDLPSMDTWTGLRILDRIPWRVRRLITESSLAVCPEPHDLPELLAQSEEETRSELSEIEMRSTRIVYGEDHPQAYAVFSPLRCRRPGRRIR